MAEKTRYTDAELEEFRAIIMQKLEVAEKEYEQMKATLIHSRLWKKVPPSTRKRPPAWHSGSSSLSKG